MMPQASEDLRAKIRKRFGSLDDGAAWDFLKSKGYTMEDFYISAPTPLHRATADENECIDFLCEEWDWGYSATAA